MVRMSASSPLAIVVLGEKPYAESRGDLPTLEYPGESHDLELLRRLQAGHIPVVAVLLSGRPLSVDAELDAADSFVAAWLPGTEGGGVADVLFRAPDGSVPHEFRGRLPFSWPRSPGSLGGASATAAEGAPAGPRFPLGYGLNYRTAVRHRS